jgi:plasmid replication initiation protein
MRKLFVRLLKRLTKSLDEEQGIICQPYEIKEIPKEEHRPEAKVISPIKIEDTENKPDNKPNKKTKKKTSTEITKLSFDPRDIMDTMEFPFLSLSKNRTTPIDYESPNGVMKVKVTCHTNQYLASIYDWDIILFFASKIQENINTNSDIPPKTFIIPRHKLLKALHKYSGKTNRKEIEASLVRLKLTGIETTVSNEDYRYRSGFGFIDSWGYTERKDIKEFRITLSDWTYDLICRQGSLLKSSPEYFALTSGLKRFLYRTARKHVGTQNHNWDILLETLYEKSGTEQDLRKFKYDLKKAISDDDIPGYPIEWIEKDGKILIRFINGRKKIKRILSEPSDQPNLPFL